MVTIKCGQCGKILEIPAEFGGQTGRCTNCGGKILVPMVNPEIKPVPKWKIGCLIAALCFAMLFVIAGVTAPRPPITPKGGAKFAPASAPTLAPVAPPKPLTLAEILAKAIGPCNRENAPSISVTDAANYVSVKFAVNDNLTTSFVIGGAKMDTIEILEVISKERPGYSVSVEGTFPLVDKFGNSEEKTVFSCNYSGNTIARINFKNILTDNAWAIADSADIHPAFR